MNHHTVSTSIYKGCGESFKGINPSLDTRMGFTPLYNGILEGSTPFNESLQLLH